MGVDGIPPGRARVAVVAHGTSDGIHARAAVLAQELGLPLYDKDQVHDSASGKADVLLIVGEHRLELRQSDRRGSGPVYVDFVRGAVGYRRQSGLSRRQPIALAVGLRRGPPMIVDATAGLAGDSFLLACLGCTVVAVERSPVLGALIRDGLRRAIAEGPPAIHSVLDRISLVVSDARHVLERMSGPAAPDAVYIDPMYPPKRKTALPRKEMRLCRLVVGDDPDAGELLAVARRVAKRRVVVKRHRHAPPLAPAPTLRFVGKKVRYDVYCSGA